MWTRRVAGGGWDRGHARHWGVAATGPALPGPTTEPAAGRGLGGLSGPVAGASAHPPAATCANPHRPAAPRRAPQYDVHLPLLTVRETLTFARAALWASGTKNDLANEFRQVRLASLVCCHCALHAAAAGPRMLPLAARLPTGAASLVTAPGAGGGGEGGGSTRAGECSAHRPLPLPAVAASGGAPVLQARRRGWPDLTRASAHACTAAERPKALQGELVRRLAGPRPRPSHPPPPPAPCPNAARSPRRCRARWWRS